MYSMTTQNKAYLFLVSAVLLGLFTIVSAFAPPDEGLHQAMEKMMQKMKAIKMTGDPDKDFAAIMIEHHQGAIDMAGIVVKSGKDQKIRSMAQKTLQTQPDDQKKLRKYMQMQHDEGATAKNNKSHSAHAQSSDASSHSDQFTSEIKKLMDQMESKMKTMKMSGNVDHDFATMMVGHHQAAIDMANIEAKHGRNTEVKAIAEKIKVDSEKDIIALQNWLTDGGK